jgi:hypothetical protein
VPGLNLDLKTAYPEWKYVGIFQPKKVVKPLGIWIM